MRPHSKPRSQQATPFLCAPLAYTPGSEECPQPCLRELTCVGAQSQAQGWPQPGPRAPRRPAWRRWPARLAFINPHCFFWSQRPLSSASPQVGAESQGSVHTPKAHAGQERGASSEQPCKGLGLGQGSGYRRPEQAPQTNSNSQQPPTERQDLRGDPNPKGRTVPHSGVQLLHSQKGTPHVPQRPRWPSGHPQMQRGTGYPRGSHPPINQPWPSVQRDEHAN